MLRQNQETIPSPIHDHPDWRRDRQDYSVWLIELGRMEVAQKVTAAREHLSAFLVNPYQRQPHITVYVCGFLSDTPRYDDDYSAEQLEHHAHLLRAAAVPPFAVEIGGLNSFASAPFLEVADLEGGLDRMRALLSTTGKEVGRSVYTPHITVGLYSGAFPGSAVLEKISSFPKDPCKLAVDRITFATYQAREIAGALTGKFEVALQPA
jgi:2'-5' RNA ligase